MQKNHQFFVREITKWYKSNLRDLPWRNTQNPYFIWLSEVILQQTRVEQGTPYYHRFVTEFPDVSSLAMSSEESVLKLWEGLGYYSRARNLHTAAKTIFNEFNGVFPDTYEEIKSLKGVGDYTAAAIASLAFDLPHAVVDGNVYRVLSRYFGIQTPIDTTKGKKEFNALANELLDTKNPGVYNQAVMEFGALHCTPKQPQCETCPLQSGCVAYKNDLVGSLPIKEKKTKVKERYFNYLVMEDGENTYINRRSGDDIWKGLYEFPMVETEKKIENGDLPPLPVWLKSKEFAVKRISEEYRHVLTHRRLYARFYSIKLKEKIEEENLVRIKRGELSNFAFPKLILRFLDERE